ncbi:MAG: chromosome segregation protein SMC, partial [bacterium]|nr:chromosome segregation protein SMC [bacterium]
EIIKEFRQTKERNEFLEREMQDLENSARSIRQIIEELDAKIDERFRAGLEKINAALRIFFTQLFGGGDARLELETAKGGRKRAAFSEYENADYEEGEDVVQDEPEKQTAGLGIKVQLPRKQVRGLEVLSGGERALTSIALIFAMSQVNPPPFLILDETDAALDEANSRRYGDMIENLARHSQLIVITHNRETMSRAGILYGVTMGGDGVSKLLSVKFEDALAVAK